MGQFHFDPQSYLELMRAEVPLYDAFQDHVAAETRGIEAFRILELGTGTGETARRVLVIHPRATLTGIDASEGMLELARATLDPRRVESLTVARLEDSLPEGPFDLTVSLAVHHLDGAGKADLFRRVAAALRPGGRFVLGDVIVPERPEDALTPLTPEFDRPDRLADLLAWLEAAGFESRVAWLERDLAVLVVDHRG